MSSDKSGTSNISWMCANYACTSIMIVHTVQVYIIYIGTGIGKTGIYISKHILSGESP